MRKEINKNILKSALKKLEEWYYSYICPVDTIIRIGNDEKKLYGCKDCVYKEVADICPKLIKREIEDVFYMR